MRVMLELVSALTVLLLAHGPLAHAHWPGQPEHQMAYLGDLKLEDGGVIPNLRISYVTHGKLNAAKDNAILFMHGWAANHHSGDHLIGPGRPLDTDKYFIICSDELGNPQTTFEHSTSPTNSGMKMSFPQYKARDRVKAEHMLVAQTLGIPRLLAATGISTGADASVQMAVSYPDFVHGIFPISGGGLYTTQGFSFGPLILSILESCAGWHGGNYDENPKVCVANRDFVQRNPIATKRALRAILKATDVCADDPECAARFLSEKLYEPRYPIGLEVMRSALYARWREANPEDTLRFYALRLHEVGMIKSTPQKLIAQGTDWRFLNELKKELKA